MAHSAHNPEIFIKETINCGRTVCAGRTFDQGELIEVCPVIVIGGDDERPLLDRTPLFDYYFAWGADGTQNALALGFGSLYNHSYTPNATHICDYRQGEIRFYARQRIAPGDEIRINYNGEDDSRDPLWFEPIEEHTEVAGELAAACKIAVDHFELVKTVDVYKSPQRGVELPEVFDRNIPGIEFPDHAAQ